MYYPRIKHTKSHLLIIDRELHSEEIEKLGAIRFTDKEYIYTFDFDGKLDDAYCYLCDCLEDGDTAFNVIKVENQEFVY